MKRVNVAFLLVAVSLIMAAGVMEAFHVGLVQRLSSTPDLRTLLGFVLLLVAILLAIWWRLRHRDNLALLGLAAGNGVLGLIGIIEGLTEGRRSPVQDGIVFAALIFGRMAFIALPLIGAWATKRKSVS